VSINLKISGHVPMLVIFYKDAVYVKDVLTRAVTPGEVG